MKKIFIILFFILIITTLFSVSSYAVTAPSIRITSHKYSNGDKMQNDEITDVQVGKKLQLYAVIAYGNELRKKIG